MRHILYFAGYRMVVLRWQANAFTGMAEFEPDDKGYAAFERLVRIEIKKPVKMLVDIIEEDIRLDTAPYLIGRDRAAFHTRLINRYFRQYPHTSLQIQGRQLDGRRDNNVLLMALTNSKLFQRWLDILENSKAPMEGIYSLPLTGEALLKPLHALEQNALVISQQVPSSIRQSFYAQGKLKLSRLVPSGDSAGDQHEVLRDESNRTVRYLENQHYVDTQRKLHIYIIAPGAEHESLQSVLKSDTRKEYHLIDKDRLAFDIGVKGLIPGEYSFWLYAHVLLSGKRRKPHYINPADRKYYYHYLAQIGMFGSSVAAVAAIFLWGAVQLINSYLLSEQELKIQSEANAYQQQYEIIVKDIAELDLNVADVRSAVNLADTLKARYQSTPLDFFEILSVTLSKHPDIELRKMEWMQTHNRNHSFGESKKQLNPALARVMQSGMVGFLYQKSLFDAVVSDYDENPRIALEKMDSFIRDLIQQQNEYAVEIVKMPFDIDPASRFVGQAGSGGADQEAKFSFVMSKEVQL